MCATYIMTSVDIQLSRNDEGRLPYLTHWSRHEPASIRRKSKCNTDHWTKTKHKNVTVTTCGKDQSVHTFPGIRGSYEEATDIDAQHIHHGYNMDGTMKHAGTFSLTSGLVNSVHVNWPPGNYNKTRPPRRQNTRSVFNERAKEGFEYWIKEQKPMTAGSKRWIGSGGNVIGTSRK